MPSSDYSPLLQQIFFNLSAVVKLPAGAGAEARWDAVVVEQGRERSTWKGLQEQSWVNQLFI